MGYNLGRKQWKLVQPNETNEAIIDDDEKKHPEIVKNGKKLENGGEDVESANIDPASEKVAYTSEKKPESNGNGIAPGVADLTVTEESADTEASEPQEGRRIRA